MSKTDVLEVRGRIEEVYSGAKFRVVLENNHTVLAHLSGKMRMNHIRLNLGDEVRLEMTPYDLTKGRIVFRY